MCDPAGSAARAGLRLAARFAARGPLRCLGVTWAVFLALPAGARADEVVVQNDSVTDFGQVAIQAGFAADERAAAWLTSPCDGDIVAVQMLWQSLSGNTPPMAGDSISIHAAGTFPVPGTLLELLPAPLLSDGFLNEFRYVDEAGTVPLVVPVDENELFVVSFRFAEAPGGGGASVVTDINGCQAGKNGLFAIPPSTWFSSCMLGLSGDFVIRAVVDCPATGPDPIFVDGFESGDTNEWSAVVP
jgi:hypothetical protein